MTTTHGGLDHLDDHAAPDHVHHRAPVAMSKAEIGQWKTDALAFADRFYGAWPDPDATFTEFADDASFYDPSNGDFLVEGKGPSLRSSGTSSTTSPTSRSTRRRGRTSRPTAPPALYATENLWPPMVPEPANHPPVGVLELFRFKDGQVASYEIWMSAATSRDDPVWGVRPG